MTFNMWSEAFKATKYNVDEGEDVSRNVGGCVAWEELII